MDPKNPLNDRDIPLPPKVRRYYFSGVMHGGGRGGFYIPFAATKADRLAASDPRPSLEERYGTDEKYVAVVRAAAARLVRGGFLLRDDTDRLIVETDANKGLKATSSASLL